MKSNEKKKKKCNFFVESNIRLCKKQIIFTIMLFLGLYPLSATHNTKPRNLVCHFLWLRSISC